MIENVQIKGSAKTPEIIADSGEGEISISGYASLKHSVDYFAPLNEWLTEYFQQPQKLTRFNFRLKYLSTSASLCITNIMNRISQDFSKDNKIVIFWYTNVNDEDMYEEGNDYKDQAKVPFHLVIED
ncbi:MAG: DUF1987 domain-containing protein [Bacteroidales bacterium]|nr:DUF1987 domain-containing protein [Bacteroidales bacterium]